MRSKKQWHGKSQIATAQDSLTQPLLFCKQTDWSRKERIRFTKRPEAPREERRAFSEGLIKIAPHSCVCTLPALNHYYRKSRLHQNRQRIVLKIRREHQKLSRCQTTWNWLKARLTTSLTRPARLRPATWATTTAAWTSSKFPTPGWRNWSPGLSKTYQTWTCRTWNPLYRYVELISSPIPGLRGNNSIFLLNVYYT